MVSNLGVFGARNDKGASHVWSQTDAHLLVEPLIAILGCNFLVAKWLRSHVSCSGLVKFHRDTCSLDVPFRGKNTQPEDLCSHLDISKNCPIFALGQQF